MAGSVRPAALALIPAPTGASGVGVFAIFEDCGDAGARYVVVAAEGPGYIVQIAVQANTQEDLAAMDRVLGSFYASF